MLRRFGWIKNVPEVVTVNHKIDILSLVKEVIAGVKTRDIKRIVAKISVVIKNVVRRGIGFFSQGCIELMLIGRKGNPKVKPEWVRQNTPIGLVVGDEKSTFWHPVRTPFY